MTQPRLPTGAELTILRVLWTQGPSTVRTVHNALQHEERTAYTTTLKLMQIMHGKRLVERDESSRSHVYSANVQDIKVERHYVANLVEKVFAGSAARMVMRALSSQPASAEEVADIRQLLNELEQREVGDD